MTQLQGWKINTLFQLHRLSIWNADVFFVKHS